MKDIVYLGVLINEKGQEEQEIEARILKGNKKYGMIQKLLKSTYTSRRTKIRMYKTIIRPTVTYGCETWAMKKYDEEKLERWERKMLRRIFGGIKTEDGWRRRTNEELRNIYKEPLISAYIRSQRIRWIGHIERMNGDRMPKIILQRKPIGKKKKGRPRKRWKNEVIGDLEKLNIKDWKEKARDRRKWRDITARGLQGL